MNKWMVRAMSGHEPFMTRMDILSVVRILTIHMVDCNHMNTR